MLAQRLRLDRPRLSLDGRNLTEAWACLKVVETAQAGMMTKQCLCAHVARASTLGGRASDNGGAGRFSRQ